VSVTPEHSGSIEASAPLFSQAAVEQALSDRSIAELTTSTSVAKTSDLPTPAPLRSSLHASSRVSFPKKLRLFYDAPITRYMEPIHGRI
jgi:hypothetical protein